jgi:hypothetical protein
MTEAAFQAARSIMQKANYIRGLITKAKGDVAKWTKIEDTYRHDNQLTRADGARKSVLRSMETLNKHRKALADLKFPDNDLVVTHKQNTCQTCGEPIGKLDKFCDDICEMAGTSVNRNKNWKNKPLRQID